MIAVIQFRTDKSLEHEQVCFERHLPDLNLDFISVFDDKSRVEASHLMENYNKVILAGSSELLLSRDDPLTREARTTILPTIRKLIIADFPTLGICFGHQLINLALGGVVENEKSQAEGGIQTIEFTEKAWSDPLFEGLNNPLSVSEGHNDSVVSMPQGAVHLAFSGRCNSQAVRLGDNVYGLQFHPELSLEDMEERWEISTPFKGERTGPAISTENHGPTVLSNFAYNIAA